MSGRRTASPCAKGLSGSLRNFVSRGKWTRRRVRMYFPWRAAFQVKDMQVNAKPFPQLVSFGCSRYRERGRETSPCYSEREEKKRETSPCVQTCPTTLAPRVLSSGTVSKVTVARLAAALRSLWKRATGGRTDRQPQSGSSAQRQFNSHFGNAAPLRFVARDEQSVQTLIIN